MNWAYLINSHRCDLTNRHAIIVNHHRPVVNHQPHHIRTIIINPSIHLIRSRARTLTANQMSPMNVDAMMVHCWPVIHRNHCK